MDYYVCYIFFLGGYGFNLDRVYLMSCFILLILILKEFLFMGINIGYDKKVCILGILMIMFIFIEIIDYLVFWLEVFRLYY